MVKLVDTLGLGSSSLWNRGSSPLFGSMQHSLWNMYARLRNGALAGKKSVFHPKNVFLLQLLRVLYKEGYINGFRFFPENLKMVEIFLKYPNGKPAFSVIKALSRPGRRIYVSAKTLWKVETSLKTLIVSTPQGIFSAKECRERNLGGEILCVLF